MTAHHGRIVLLVPFGTKRHLKLHLPPDVAQWLHAQLGESLGLPRPAKPHRRVKIRRGKWTDRRAER